jgi:hypothetical protein
MTTLLFVIVSIVFCYLVLKTGNELLKDFYKNLLSMWVHENMKLNILWYIQYICKKQENIFDSFMFHIGNSTTYRYL